MIVLVLHLLKKEETPVSASKSHPSKAKEGDAEWQFQLGLWHSKNGGDNGGAEAAKWYRKAADQGHAAGQYL